MESKLTRSEFVERLRSAAVLLAGNADGGVGISIHGVADEHCAAFEEAASVKREAKLLAGRVGWCAYWSVTGHLGGVSVTLFGGHRDIAADEIASLLGAKVPA